MMRQVLAALVILLAGISGLPPAGAQPLPGADDPALVAARDAWLEGGDDMAVLRALAPLARGGNPAAQMFIAALTDIEHLRPEGLAELARADRIALTRAPGGLSGTSWRRVAAENLPLAGALERVQSGMATESMANLAAALTELLEGGETRAALLTIQSLANIGGTGPDGGWRIVADQGTHPTLAGEQIAPLETTRDVLADPAKGAHDQELALRLMANINAMGVSASDLALVRAAMSPWTTQGDPFAWAAAARTAETSTLTAPLATFCRETCPNRIGQCALALLAVLGGAPGYITLSPLEGVIPSATYRASPRFAQDLRRGYAPALPLLERIDECAAVAIGG